MTEIHNYPKRLERFRRNVSKHKYGSMAAVAGRRRFQKKMPR